MTVIGVLIVVYVGGFINGAERGPATLVGPAVALLAMMFAVQAGSFQ